LFRGLNYTWYGENGLEYQLYKLSDSPHPLLDVTIWHSEPGPYPDAGGSRGGLSILNFKNGDFGITLVDADFENPNSYANYNSYTKTFTPRSVGDFEFLLHKKLENLPPVEMSESNITLQDIREQTGDVGASDEDGDTLTYTVTTDAVHGTLSVDENGIWTYNVEGTYIGEDSAVIAVDDGNGGTVTKTLNFNVGVSAPTIDTLTYVLNEDSIATESLNINNPVGGSLTYEIIESSQYGAFTIGTNGAYNYTPIQDYNGTDGVTLKVTNEYGLSTTSHISFEVQAVNDAPVVEMAQESFTLFNIRDIDGKVEASDIDGDTLTYSVVTQAANGLVTVDHQGNWHYKADGSFNGSDSAVILVDDGNGGTVTSTLNFTVEGYIYEGSDLIITDNGQDTLVMNSINKSDLSFTRTNNNLLVNVKGQGSITLTNYFNSINSGVATLSTADGDINLSKDVIKNVVDGGWFFADKVKGNKGAKNLLIGTNDDANLIGKSLNDILFAGSDGDKLYGNGGNDLLVGGNNHDTLYGDAGDDNLYGQAGNDRLYGNEGHDFLSGGIGSDYLYGGDGHDMLFGGANNDNLYGEEGNDFLSGGSGNDRLKGSVGDDTYLFEKGDGVDLIVDKDDSSLFFFFGQDDAGDDTIKFGEGIGIDDISFTMSYGDLTIQYGDSDLVKVRNQTNSKEQIERIELSDGNYLTNEDIDLVVQQINAYGQENGMWNISNGDIRNNEELMNIVSSAWNK